MAQEIIIKQKSIPLYLKEHYLEEIYFDGMGKSTFIDAVHVLKKESLHFRKTSGLNAGDTVRFVINEKTTVTNKDVDGEIVFKVEEYDSYSLILELIKDE